VRRAMARRRGSIHPEQKHPVLMITEEIIDSSQLDRDAVADSVFRARREQFLDLLRPHAEERVVRLASETAEEFYRLGRAHRLRLAQPLKGLKLEKGGE
jgi:hypothetical protein